MQSAILTLNVGSSSLKFSVYSEKLDKLLAGQIEALNEKPSFYMKDSAGKMLDQIALKKEQDETAALLQAVGLICKSIKKYLPDYEISAVGHRVVHGGHLFSAPVIVDDGIMQQLQQYSPVAPLHQPFNLAGIEIAKKLLPKSKQIACFDTAFHANEDVIAQAYALPDHLASVPIKRYGFHGLSYEYIASVAAKYIGENKAKGKLIVAHLGHGASMCAIENGKSVATTMGFTALDGLPMGTRCGNLDPGVLLYLLQQGMSIDELTDVLYHQSGLKGVSQMSSDVRDLLASNAASAKKALEIFIYRIQREMGSLAAALQGVDSIIFTAGIGENAAEIRARICEKLAWLGIAIDAAANQNNIPKISSENSKVCVWVIPTNEELMIAKHVQQLL